MNNNKTKIWALIPAAGIGTRMKSELPKQYLEIDGKTILEHSLSKFLEHPSIDKVVVALHPNDNHWAKIKIANHSKIITVEGGATRAESVLNGLKAIQQQHQQDDWVMVHDAARPCLDAGSIDALIQAGKESKHGAILAIPSVDTVKLANANQTIDKTLNREQIWLAQTPQYFPVQILADAIETGLEQGLAITDEASAIEAQGMHPALVIGTRKNIKVTQPEDMMLASVWLAGM
ncbi:2-C-methyl-D-erythritol 4-phosphate cytidylyltransferase [Kangiella aquimarina]|uniref:2-C-methyl-D-erythritol 4-phosphate cytidylyltransferase n=1 Tax=Kangiella aquimarina TaxID=261965 RepID=A0ABZ0X3J7_9GAMM|nr:2-C-methyl-D-erythritol 4-phosphate cytidylyltransferase [Kangiella aquimarina]WQG84867.1 2-C-methyl-D-erythritol 4-phosphate cytidylyltransferase [Kangiella aquimarina]